MHISPRRWALGALAALSAAGCHLEMDAGQCTPGTTGCSSQTGGGGGASSGVGGGGMGGASQLCTPAEIVPCYGGPPGTLGVGACTDGTQQCNAEGTAFLPCTGDVTPQLELCGSPVDINCDGLTNEPCICVPGEQISCYAGPAGTENVGTCTGGISTCNVQGTAYGACAGDVVPSANDCTSGPDSNCDGAITCDNATHLWSRCVADLSEGGTQHVRMARDAANNLFLVGDVRGKLDFGGVVLQCEPKQGPYDVVNDIFFAKLDPNGNLLWSKNIGNPGIELFGDLAVDSAGNVVLAGEFCCSVLIRKFDPDGNLLWKTNFTPLNGSVCGTEANSVAIDGADNILVAGSIWGDLPVGSQLLVNTMESDIFMLKLDPNGQPIWAKNFGDHDKKLGQTIAVDAAGNSLLAGRFTGTIDLGGGPLDAKGYDDEFLAKFDPDGNHLWSKRFGDSVQALGDALVRADGAGNVLYAVSSSELAIDFGGGPIVAIGSWDQWVAKFDPDGNHLWSRRVGNDLLQEFVGMEVDSADNLVLVGESEGDIVIDGTVLMGHGKYDAFVMKLRPDGSHLWSRLFPGDYSYGAAESVCTDSDDNLVFVGMAELPPDFGGGPLTPPCLYAAKLGP